MKINFLKPIQRDHPKDVKPLLNEDKTQKLQNIFKYDLWILLANFILYIFLWIMNLAAVLSPYSAHLIIWGGLTPLFIICLCATLFYFFVGLFAQMISWKEPEFWVPLVTVVVLIIGLAACWSEMASHYESNAATNADGIRSIKVYYQTDVNNYPNDPSKWRWYIGFVNDPGIYSNNTTAAQWISVILISFGFAGMFWLWYRSYYYHKLSKLNIIDSEKQVEQFIIDHDLETEEQKTERLAQERQQALKKQKKKAK